MSLTGSVAAARSCRCHQGEEGLLRGADPRQQGLKSGGIVDGSKKSAVEGKSGVVEGVGRSRDWCPGGVWGANARVGRSKAEVSVVELHRAPLTRPWRPWPRTRPSSRIPQPRGPSRTSSARTESPSQLRSAFPTPIRLQETYLDLGDLWCDDPLEDKLGDAVTLRDF